MSLIPRPLKKILQRSQKITRFYSRLNWQIHLFKDWWGTKVWKKTTEVVTPLGFKLISGLHPAYEMMRNGTFEPEETALIQEYLNKIDLFVDIGANLGFYTCLALQSGKQVIAFEPQPQNLNCLFQNILANGWEDNAEVFPLALSEKPGLLTLYGASGPSASLIQNWAGYSSRYKQIVPVSTLDNILDGRSMDKRLFIKVDVEGAEFQVLSGAKKTLGRPQKPTWLIEICLQEFHPDGMNPDFRNIFQLFWENGYQAYTATKTPIRITPSDVDRWIEKQCCDSGTFNYLFVGIE